MPLVEPLIADADRLVAERSAFFSETPGFTPDPVLTMQRLPEIAQALTPLNRWNDAMATALEAPAAPVADAYLKAAGWTAGKHGA